MKRTLSIIHALLVPLLVAAGAVAQPQSATPAGSGAGTDPWNGVRFLVGDWVGSGSGRPGEGSGGFSFRFDLDGRVLVRRDHAEYPASAGRPAVVHDGLMVVYPRSPGPGLAAVYFDNEGHVIHYDLSTVPGSGSVVFLSGAATGSPRYRLTYEPLASGEVMVTFEIAPPGEPPAFKAYVAGRSRRVGR